VCLCPAGTPDVCTTHPPLVSNEAIRCKRATRADRVFPHALLLEPKADRQLRRAPLSARRTSSLAQVNPSPLRPHLVLPRCSTPFVLHTLALKLLALLLRSSRREELGDCRRVCGSGRRGGHARATQFTAARAREVLAAVRRATPETNACSLMDTDATMGTRARRECHRFHQW